MDTHLWQSIIDQQYTVPEGKTATELMPELLSLLGSTDGHIRDDFGYGILAQWVAMKPKYSADELRTMRDHLLPNLTQSNNAYMRSFSALALALIAYNAMNTAFLTTNELQALVQSALKYLAEEQDERGYVVGEGWLHALAHTADWLKFLARNPKTDSGDLVQILTGIADRLMKLTTTVYIHDEDERLALAVLDVLKRDKLGSVVLEGWLKSFTEWKQAHTDLAFDVQHHAVHQNIQHFLRSLYFKLEMTPDLPETAKAFQDAVKLACGVFSS